MSMSMDNVEGQIERAEALNDLGRHAEAIQLLAPVFAARPDHPWALCAMARAQLGLERYADALANAVHAAGRLPHLPWPALLASWAAGGLDRDEEAANWAKEAVRRDPHNAVCHQRVAYAMLAIGEFGIAQSAAAHCLQLDPNRAESYVLNGVIAHEFDQRKRAETFYKQALAIEPDNSRAHQGLARLSMSADRYVDGRNLARAAESLATAVRVDPKSADTRALLDVILHKFLARAAYFVCVGVIIARLVLNGAVSTTTRLIPLALLAVPAFFVVRFVSTLPPALRGHVSTMVRSRRVAPPIGLLIVALALLVAGALVPPYLRAAALGGALLLAVAARIQMEAEFRRVQRRLDPALKPLLRTWLLWPLFLVVALIALATVVTLGSSPSLTLSVVIATCMVLLAGWLGLTVWARHAGAPPRWWQRISATDWVPAAVAGILAAVVVGSTAIVALTEGERTTFDRARVEGAVASRLQPAGADEVRVDCPDGVDGYVGESFRCDVAGAEQVWAVRVTLQPNGGYDVEDLRRRR